MLSAKQSSKRIMLGSQERRLKIKQINDELNLPVRYMRSEQFTEQSSKTVTPNTTIRGRKSPQMGLKNATQKLIQKKPSHKKTESAAQP